MKLIPILAVAVLAIHSFAQTGSKAEVFSGKDVSAQLATLAQTSKASGSSGATLGDYTSHAIKLSVRTASGGAEIHAHYDDIFVVTEGKATLIPAGPSRMRRQEMTARQKAPAFKTESRK